MRAAFVLPLLAIAACGPAPDVGAPPSATALDADFVPFRPLDALVAGSAAPQAAPADPLTGRLAALRARAARLRRTDPGL